MQGIIFDLKKFRSQQLNGMSQEEFARQIGVSQDKVSRIEANPGQIPLEIILSMAEHFGMELNDLIKLSKETKALEVRNTWSDAEYIKQSLIEYVAYEGIKAGYTYQPQVSQFYELVTGLLQKPKVAFLGRSDVGKSTLINALLGAKRMPAHYTPTTAIAVHIKHINNRPDFMENNDVWIFRSSDTGEAWDDRRLGDEAYCRSLKLSAGNYDLLNTFGTRQGEHFQAGLATSAVVFIESRLLLNCDIVDLPGFGTGDRVEDDSIPLNEKAKADVLVYLSHAGAFLRTEDISYIKDLLSTLPDCPSPKGIPHKPLGNLFIVASHAHTVDDKSELPVILEEGCHRLEESMSENFLDEEKKTALRSRFFTYTTNALRWREDFEREFIATLELLPNAIQQHAVESIATWIQAKDAFLRETIAYNQKILYDHTTYLRVLEEYQHNDEVRKMNFDQEKFKIRDLIRKYKKQCLDELTHYYNKTITVDHLETLLKDKNVKKKKEAIQSFAGYTTDLIKNKANALIRDQSKALTADINHFLSSFENASLPSLDGKLSIGISTFKKEQAFAAGLAGATTYGALAIWAASCGNLGGYILVAKGVSLLSTLGISVGGTAAAVSAVSAIGGPVVLGITLSVTAALAAFAAFSGGWRTTVAKKLVNAFRKEDVLEKLSAGISEYWDDTEKSFLAAADHLNAEWENHFHTIKCQLDSYDPRTIQASIAEAEAMRNFLKNIPNFPQNDQ